VAFFAHALLMQSWQAHLPAMQTSMGISDAALGAALLGAPVGGLIGVLAWGRAVARLGSDRVMRLTLPGFALLALTLAVADNAVTLFAAVAVWGACGAGFELAMNAQAVTVEQAAGTPVMARLHGLWSCGGLTGSMVAAAAVAAGVHLAWQAAVLGALAFTAVGLGSRSLLPDATNPAAGQPSGSRRGGATVWALAGLAVSAMLVEGITADWSAVLLRNSFHASPGIAGLALSGFCAAMLLVRMASPALHTRVSTPLLLTTLAGTAAVVMSGALLIAAATAAIIGFTALGIGVGLVVPSAFSAAGASAGANCGAAVATISACGWVTFLAAPALVGSIADKIGLPHTLWILPVTAAAIAVASAVILPTAHSARKG